MASEWRECHLGLPFPIPVDWEGASLAECCELVRDGDWIETKDQGGNDYRLLQISNIGRGSFVETGNYRWITSETFTGLRCTAIEEGDVLVARMPEPTGRAWHVVALSWPAVTAVDVAIIRTDRSRLDPRFLSYFLNSDPCLALIDGLTTGTTRRRIRRADIERLAVPLPPLAEQRAIARVLGALDDKIELNRRMSETLEEMARALFRSWFVDFDPVRAKAEGRPSGLPPDLDALFPASFEASELGEIPAGWEVRTLGDVVDISSGRRPKQRHPRPAVTADVPVFGGAGAMAYTADALYASPVIITGRVGTLGVVHRVSFPVWPSDNTLVIIPRSGPEFVWLLGVVSKINLSNLNRGSTQPLITQRDLKAQTIVVPPKSLLLHFADLTDPLYASSDSTSDLSGTMADLRDALLPRLVSGELRVIRRDRGHY